MSLLERLVPRVGQERRAREAEALALKNASEDSAANKLSLKDIANQVGETEFRKMAGGGVMQGPLPEGDTGFSQAISRNLMDNPEKLAMEIPASHAQKFNPVLDMLTANRPGGSREMMLKLSKERLSALQDERNKNRNERRGKNLAGITDRFNSDPSIRKSQESIDSAAMVRQMADSDNPVAAAAIPTIMARASREVGNLSEADKAPFGGSRAIIARLDQIAVEAASGKLSDNNKIYVKGLADLFESNAISAKKRLAKERSKQYRGIENFPSEQEILMALDPGMGAAATPALPGNTGTTSGLSKEEQDEMAQLEAELNALGAK